MIGFFRSVAEAVIEKGVRALLEEVPFGKFFLDVAERIVQKEKARRQKVETRAEFERIVTLSHDAARDEARAALAEAAREQDVAVPPAELEAAAEWVAGIPEAARVSNRRPDDPAGITLAPSFVLDSPDDVLKVLPPRPPRFLAGQPVPGRDGEWVLESVLGIGGFGEVWLARHTTDGHPPRAVKFFFDQTGRDVRREADLVRRAVDAGLGDSGRDDDPRRHIVPILDVHLTGDPPWLMFEYVGGGNLATWLLQLAGRPAAAARVPQVVAALKQLCRGAGVFHGLPAPIVHRDLKPSNVLVDRVSKKLRITDFGIGAVTQQVTNARETRGETSKGERLLSYLRGAHTPTYSSPEQRTGAPPDPRDDVHALGVIGYQMLVGDLAAAPAADLTDDLRDCDTPHALIEVIAACVARKRDRRPADARDLGARLDAVARSRAVNPASVAVATPAEAAAPSAREPGAVFALRLPGPAGAGLAMPFYWVPPGTVALGSPLQEDGRSPHESERAFTTHGFWLGKYPVTQAEWAAVMAGTAVERPSGFRPTWLDAKRGRWDTARHPVESVSVPDGEAFLRRLGSGARLPTEDEWEYACRGGRGNRVPFYWGWTLNGTQANVDGRTPYGPTIRGPYRGMTCPVEFTNDGTYPDHPWGLCHLIGNVWEWCDNPAERPNYYILRGGAWDAMPSTCRAAYRFRNAPQVKGKNIGLRVCLDAV